MGKGGYKLAGGAKTSLHSTSYCYISYCLNNTESVLKVSVKRWVAAAPGSDKKKNIYCFSKQANFSQPKFAKGLG